MPHTEAAEGTTVGGGHSLVTAALMSSDGSRSFVEIVSIMVGYTV